MWGHTREHPGRLLESVFGENGSSIGEFKVEQVVGFAGCQSSEEDLDRGLKLT